MTGLEKVNLILKSALVSSTGQHLTIQSIFLLERKEETGKKN